MPTSSWWFHTTVCQRLTLPSLYRAPNSLSLSLLYFQDHSTGCSLYARTRTMLLLLLLLWLFPILKFVTTHEKLAFGRENNVVWKVRSRMDQLSRHSKPSESSIISHNQVGSSRWLGKLANQFLLCILVEHKKRYFSMWRKRVLYTIWDCAFVCVFRTKAFLHVHCKSNVS